MSFAWRPEFELGIGKLDLEHREMVTLASQVAARVREGARASEIAAALRALAFYTAGHFAAEESLMEVNRFPDRALHREHHRELLDQLERFARRLLEGNQRFDDHVKMLAFLDKWVSGHILHSDRELAAHLAPAEHR